MRRTCGRGTGRRGGNKPSKALCGIVIELGGTGRSTSVDRRVVVKRASY